jgi:HlyD family secretion protein
MEKKMTKKDTEPADAQALGIQEQLGRGSRVGRWLAVAAGLTAVITLIAWVRSDTSSAPTYKTQPVELGSLMVTVSATGNLEPINQVDVGSELSGIIDTVNVDYNDAVKAGAALATLDVDRLEAQVFESQSALESAQAKVLNAEATLAERRLSLDRTAELVRKELSPQTQLDEAEAAFKRAQAELASVKAQASQSEATLNARQTDLGKAVIRSPINGIVLDRSIEPGQTVAASLQSPVLFTLAEDLTQMELHVAIDEADVGYVREGQAATFTVDAYPEHSFPATITQLRYASETVAGVVTYEAVLRVDNSDLLLRPGMTATAEIVVETVEEAVLVPNAALRFEPPDLEEKPSSRNSSILSAILPRRGGQPRDKSASKESDGERVWTLRDGRPVAAAISTGVTDGRMSEVIEGDLQVGAELVVGVVTGGGR